MIYNFFIRPTGKTSENSIINYFWSTKKKEKSF